MASSQRVNGVSNPVARLTISDVRLPLAGGARDSGGCVSSLGRGIQPDHIVAILNEALGPSDFMPARFPARPHRFGLPPRTPGGDISCLGDHATELTFKQAGRGFYLWIAAGRRARAGKIRALLASLNKIRIAARDAAVRPGISYRLPPGWSTVPSRLTGTSDPLERFAVASFPLTASQLATVIPIARCAAPCHPPGSSRSCSSGLAPLHLCASRTSRHCAAEYPSDTLTSSNASAGRTTSHFASDHARSRHS